MPRANREENGVDLEGGEAGRRKNAFKIAINNQLKE